jgi:hypothetical protein
LIPTSPLDVMRSLSFELVPNVNVLDAGVNIDEPVPKLKPELSTNVVIPENIGPESVNVTVLKPARLVNVFVRISDVIYIFNYLS